MAQDSDDTVIVAFIVFIGCNQGDITKQCHDRHLEHLDFSISI